MVTPTPMLAMMASTMVRFLKSDSGMIGSRTRLSCQTSTAAPSKAPPTMAIEVQDAQANCTPPRVTQMSSKETLAAISVTPT